LINIKTSFTRLKAFFTRPKVFFTHPKVFFTHPKVFFTLPKSSSPFQAFQVFFTLPKSSSPFQSLLHPSKVFFPSQRYIFTRSKYHFNKKVSFHIHFTYISHTQNQNQRLEDEEFE